MTRRARNQANNLKAVPEDIIAVINHYSIQYKAVFNKIKIGNERGRSIAFITQ